MSRFRTAFYLAFCLIGALGAPRASRAELVRLGGEIQVNTYTFSSQESPAVAMDADGDFVVVWADFTQDHSGAGVFARRFNSAGAALATEFQVNLFTPNAQAYPAVAMEDNGDFVIVWQSYPQDFTGNGIIARRFSADGAPLASEFLVNSFVGGSQDYPAAAMDADGDFVIAWRSEYQDGDQRGIFARRFNAAGAPLASEFQVTSYTVGYQAGESVAMDANGGFVVAWESLGQDGDQSGIFARRFSSAGVALATEFQVNTFSNYAQRDPVLDFDAQGGFVVAWDGHFFGNAVNIVARRFNSAGGSIGGEFVVNDLGPGGNSQPGIGISSDGDIMVAWQADDGSFEGIFARSLDATLSSVTAEFQVNTYTLYEQYTPAVAAEHGGDFVVVWHSEKEDGSSSGVFAQRLRSVAALDVDGNGQIDPLTDALLTLRFEFGFTGNVLTAGAVDLAGCTRCDATAILAYLKTMD